MAKNTVFLETPAAKNWPTGATQIRFFDDGMAVNFRQNSSEEALRWASNVDEFYEAFHVEPDSPMWIDPDKRVKIW